MNSYPKEPTPSTPPLLNSSSTTRTILSWALMVLLAFVLFRMASKSKDTSKSTISYSDFMQQMERNDVAEATFLWKPIQ